MVLCNCFIYILRNAKSLITRYRTSIYYSRSIVFTTLEESGQAYFSCARMPGFHFLKGPNVLACLLASIQPRTNPLKFARSSGAASLGGTLEALAVEARVVPDAEAVRLAWVLALELPDRALTVPTPAKYFCHSSHNCARNGNIGLFQ